MSILTEGLLARGIDVTLFATADSMTAGRLESVCPRPYSEDPDIDAKVWECLHIAHVLERSGDFDLIHNHLDFPLVAYSGVARGPVVTTIHGFSSERILPVFKKYNGHAHYIAISQADRHPLLDYVATIHHGIPLEEFTLRRSPDDYLLFFGRIHPDKGAAEAIEVAQRAGRRLILAGIIHDVDYFERTVAPHLDGDRIQYIGAVGPNERDRLLGGAGALLHIINFDEPFGLSMIEAMACGTPVIARPRGSVPEIVKHGENGFLVDDIDASVAAVAALGDLDRVRIRQYAEAHFSRERMVEDYIEAYRRVLARTHRAGAV